MKSEKIYGFTLRPAREDDVPLLYQYLFELATYEKIAHEFKVTQEMLRHAIFERKLTEALMAEFNGEPAGFALYFFNFSSFIGLPGLYLEDIYIRPQYRGKGFGKIVLSHLANTAIEQNCWGMEWTVLDWNTPSVEFYEKLGAFNRKGWQIFRLKGEALANLAGKH
jgi:GNAT superfamily N-acetyltransferase